jgi:hypothetical protein
MASYIAIEDKGQQPVRTEDGKLENFARRASEVQGRRGDRLDGEISGE